ncbi:peptidoglycan hydrolase CwlO-like protein [Enterococcus sp. PF1-24]|uniref:aggregation-promoting factor C-terminal-like domain-containing protein n=1 Tax=unclassified Enterococcus TaxID=2608891 RepID=UPI002472FEE7|nr:MULTISPECIES: hypothetical protein [unclassified Enterococcus]MDH6364792.1 peptidoglycan hydrolase CwlO-like protein [Enterococcus sp. PFB1-1]MDH6401863.1 peptidoglycan hydrolase CwlO-like protein [Enterococcus sp. PF1-24]
MKGKKGFFLLVVLLFGYFVKSIIVTAETLDELVQQETQLTNQSQDISVQMEEAVTQSELTFGEIEELSNRIDENQQRLMTIESEISATQSNIDARKNLLGERMRAIQVNSASQWDLQALMESESITEFINRFYVMSLLQEADSQKIQDLNSEQSALEILQNEAITTQNNLAVDREMLSAKSQAYLTQIEELKRQYAGNQELLATLLAEMRSEEERLAAEQARLAANPIGPDMSEAIYATVTDPAELHAKEWIAYHESRGLYDVYSVSGAHYGRYQLMLTYLEGDLSPENQERTADAYVIQRYGSWVIAKSFWEANNWY